MALRLAGGTALVIQGADSQGWVREITAQDALPGLKINQQGTGRVFDFQDGGASKLYLPDGGNVTIAGSLVFDLANDVTIAPTNPAAPRTLAIPAVGGNRTFAFLEEAQTFTARPTLNAGLQLGNEAADPTVAGQFSLNGANVKVYSGGAVQTLGGMLSGLSLAGAQLTQGSTNSTSAATLISVSGLSIPTGTPLLIIWQAKKSSGGGTPSECGLKLNSSQLIANADFSGSSTSSRAVFFVLFVMQRDDSSYLGTLGLAGAVGLRYGSALSGIILEGYTSPAAIITSVSVTGRSGNSDTTTSARNLYVFTLPVP